MDHSHLWIQMLLDHYQSKIRICKDSCYLKTVSLLLFTFIPFCLYRYYILLSTGASHFCHLQDFPGAMHALSKNPGSGPVVLHKGQASSGCAARTQSGVGSLVSHVRDLAVHGSLPFMDPAVVGSLPIKDKDLQGQLLPEDCVFAPVFTFIPFCLYRYYILLFTFITMFFLCIYDFLKSYSMGLLSQGGLLYFSIKQAVDWIL